MDDVGVLNKRLEGLYGAARVVRDEGTGDRSLRATRAHKPGDVVLLEPTLACGGHAYVTQTAEDKSAYIPRCRMGLAVTLQDDEDVVAMLAGNTLEPATTRPLSVETDGALAVCMLRRADPRLVSTYLGLGDCEFSVVVNGCQQPHILPVAAMMNHCCTARIRGDRGPLVGANCIVQSVIAADGRLFLLVVALTDIAAGEELTHNYTLAWKRDHDMVCVCQHCADPERFAAIDDDTLFCEPILKALLPSADIARVVHPLVPRFRARAPRDIGARRLCHELSVCARGALRAMPALSLADAMRFYDCLDEAKAMVTASRAEAAEAAVAAQDRLDDGLAKLHDMLTPEAIGKLRAMAGGSSEVDELLKIMKQAGYRVEGGCERCGLHARSRCPRCDTPYCSKECQTADWQAGHKARCVHK